MKSISKPYLIIIKIFIFGHGDDKVTFLALPYTVSIYIFHVQGIAGEGLSGGEDDD